MQTRSCLFISYKLSEEHGKVDSKRCSNPGKPRASWREFFPRVPLGASEAGRGKVTWKLFCPRARKWHRSLVNNAATSSASTHIKHGVSVNVCAVEREITTKTWAQSFLSKSRKSLGSSTRSPSPPQLLATTAYNPLYEIQLAELAFPLKPQAEGYRSQQLVGAERRVQTASFNRRLIQWYRREHSGAG